MSGRTVSDPDPLVLHSLLNDLGTLTPLVGSEIRKGSWLDAYLLAAGMAQIADDYLHPKFELFDRASSYLAGDRSAVRRAAGRGAGAVASARRAAGAMGRARRSAAAWRHELADLLDGLADAVAAGPPSPAEQSRLAEAADALTAALQRLPEGLRRGVLRVPACFCDLDQRPADLARLAERLAGRWPDRERPMLAVGVRTSGSYMAPLLAAHLRAVGYEKAEALTIRPGRGMLRDERSRIARLAEEGGLVLLTDDPPVSGSSIAASARELEAAGMPSEAIILVLALLGSDTAAPPALSSYESEILPAAEWAVGARLTPEAVEEDLARLLGPETAVTGIEPLPLPASRSPRSHRRARFLVRLRDASGSESERDVLAEGVGAGYFGAQEIAAAEVLSEFAPETYGCLDGVLYREWLPDDHRVGSVAEADEERLAAQIADYVNRRRRAMPVGEDVSIGLDDQPTWDVASSAMSNAFGRGWPLGKILLTDRAAKRLMRVADPSVIDGNMDLSHWFFRSGTSGPLVKVDVGDQRFSNFGLRCFDPAFDLAGVTAREPSGTFPRRLRRAYANLGNAAIDEERWLLYELAHLWGWQRSRPDLEAELRRARSRALQRYFADIYFADLPARRLGAALRAGRRRGAGDRAPRLPVADALLGARPARPAGARPAAGAGHAAAALTRLPSAAAPTGWSGGVAEYGAALYDAAGEAVSELLAERCVRGAGPPPRLRRAVRRHQRRPRLPPVRAGVPAAREAAGSASGTRRLPPSWRARARFARSRAMVRPTSSRRRSTRAAACGPSPRILIPRSLFAIGDTRSDLPMAANAARAYAPGHGGQPLRDGGFEVMRRPYQAGMAQAVGREIGHAPGECDVCRAPAATPERKILLAALAVFRSVDRPACRWVRRGWPPARGRA